VGHHIGACALARRAVLPQFHAPAFFDFICCFFLSGTVAAHGLNFYDPANHQAIFDNLQLPFTPGPDFFEEDRGDLDTGFLYPPPTMLYFVSLGYFDVLTAQLIWSVVSVLVLVLDIVLLRAIFFPAGEAASWPLAASVLLLCPATYRTVFFLQTTFIVLFLLLLFWRAQPRGAAWAAVAMFTKPFMGILAIWLLLRRRWRALFWFTLTAAAICIVTLLTFGPAIFQSYFTNNSVPRLHNVVYIESPNQSLLAAILRLTDYDFSYSSPLLHPVFLLTASLLGLITFFLAHRAREQDSRLTLGLMVVFALLVYPATWNHLSLLLVPSLLLMYTMLQRSTAASWLMPAFTAAVYAGMQVSSFIANLVVWAALAALCVRQLVSNRAGSSWNASSSEP